MWFHLRLQTATGRTSAIDQMHDHQIRRLLKRELRQGKDRLQQLAHVGRRERRQDLDFQLAGQVGVTRICLGPRQLGLGHKPQRQSREGQMMLPGPILLGLEFVPANLGLRIFKGALGEIALAAPRNQVWRFSKPAVSLG